MYKRQVYKPLRQLRSVDNRHAHFPGVGVPHSLGRAASYSRGVEQIPLYVYGRVAVSYTHLELADEQNKHVAGTTQYALAQQRRATEIDQQKAEFAALLSH